MGKIIEYDAASMMESFRSGNEQSMAHFFKLHAKSLGYFVRKMIPDDQEAEDIVANCFVKLWQRREDFQTEENIKAFLYISCRNACLDHLRHLKIKTTAQDNYLQHLEVNEDSILYQIIKSEILGILNQEIEQLPENYRQVFKLIYFEQKKTDEIAVELDLSVQTVRNYKSRSVELLKTAMLKKGISSAVMLALLLFAEQH